MFRGNGRNSTPLLWCRLRASLHVFSSEVFQKYVETEGFEPSIQFPVYTLSPESVRDSFNFPGNDRHLTELFQGFYLSIVYGGLSVLSRMTPLYFFDINLFFGLNEPPPCIFVYKKVFIPKNIFLACNPVQHCVCLVLNNVLINPWH